MSRVYLLVEGQTEEAFVGELLTPHYARIGLYLTPIVVSTSRGYKGGVVSYAKVRPQIVRLCRQDAGARVSTLFDLYALPTDFPGKADAAYPVAGSGTHKANYLEECLKQDINEPNFLPNLLVHEFEALLFTEPQKFAGWTDDADVVEALASAVRGRSPEDINDGPQSAPSKRVLAAMPDYQKTFHGPLIACDIGLDAIRRACAHFNAWLEKLEGLKPSVLTP